jgi:NTE family protein
MAVPGIFNPVRYENKLLVDGGFYNIAPVHLAKDADIIILIDVSQTEDDITEKSSILTVLKQSIANLQQQIVTETLKKEAEEKTIIIIRPDVSKYSLMEYRKSAYREMIKIGEEEAEKILNLPENKKILEL